MGRARIILEGDDDASGRLSQVVVSEDRFDLRVGDGDDGLHVVVNAAEDTAEAEEVLVFEIGTVGTTIDFDGDRVLTWSHGLGDVEFDEGARVFAHTDFLAVYVDVIAGFDAVEVKDDLFAFSDVAGADVEFAAIETCPVVFVGNVGRIPGGRPGVRDIGIDGVSVSLSLEVGRNGNSVPIDVGEVFRFEVEGNVVRSERKLEFPVAV